MVQWFAHISAELWTEKSPGNQIAQRGITRGYAPTVKRQIFYERVGKIKEIKLGWEYQKYENITIIDEVTDTPVIFRGCHQISRLLKIKSRI
jgi:hypothetical protein